MNKNDIVLEVFEMILTKDIIICKAKIEECKKVKHNSNRMQLSLLEAELKVLLKLLKIYDTQTVKAVNR